MLRQHTGMREHRVQRYAAVPLGRPAPTHAALGVTDWLVHPPVAGPLTVALAPDHGSASGACLRSALPQLDEDCTHGWAAACLCVASSCSLQANIKLHVHNLFATLSK
jgi:hypothetical protein